MTPINMVLASTAPYVSGAVTIGARNFAIPNVPTTAIPACSPAQTEINSRFAGSNNEISLSFAGALSLPPPPATPTVTYLTVTPPTQALAGTPVKLTASISATGTVAKAATGSVTFKDGPTVVGTGSVSGGKATLTSSEIPAKPDQPFTAVYSGDSKYAQSTSSPVNYSILSRPTVSTDLPVTLIRGTSTFTAFNVKLTNPTTGESWSSLRLALKLTTIQAQNAANVTLTYENGTHVWCSLPLRNVGTVRGTFKGLTGACGSTSSLSLAAGTSLTIPFRIKYATGANVGTQGVTWTLETVNSTGSVIAPFTTATTSGTPVNAPYARSHIQVNPASKNAVTMSVEINGTAPASATIPQGYTVKPTVTIVIPPFTTTNTIYYPTPTGTVRYLVTGHTFTPPVTSAPTPSSLESAFVSTKGLSLGNHTLTAIYSGDGIYNSGRVTKSFTVVAANPGTVFQCSRNHGQLIGQQPVGYVVASAALPSTTSSGSVAASLLAVTVHLDAVKFPAVSVANTKVTDVSISFIPGGSVTVPVGTLSITNDTVTASVSHVSAAIGPITGNIGTVVPVGIASISLSLGSTAITCDQISEPASLGSVLVSGVSLAASPVSPVAPGTNVTLSASTIPATKGGQVTFFDGTTALGTAAVPTSGTTEGVAALKVQPGLGKHTYKAVWSGTLPASVSNIVTYMVETSPVITTQPSPQTVNAGQTASFSASASGTPAPTVQWQLSTDGGIQWTTISGATGTTYATLATAVENGNRYRAVFTNAAGSIPSNAASLTVVVPPVVVTQPASQSVVPGNTAMFTSKATGSVLAVQWQVSTDGGSSSSNRRGRRTTRSPPGQQ